MLWGIWFIGFLYTCGWLSAAEIDKKPVSGWLYVICIFAWPIVLGTIHYQVFTKEE